MNVVTRTRQFLHSGLTLGLAFGLSLLLPNGALADGISGTGVVQGSIERFGSIVIDGVHYETDDSVIRINGEQAYEHDLKVGYQLTIHGDVANREAWSVDYFDTVAGPVQQVTVENPLMQQVRLQVLGQTVVSDAGTWFHGVAPEGITVGQNLAISGERMADGVIMASAIEATHRSTHVVSGAISAQSDQQLTIGSLQIDINDAQISQPLQVGDQVHVLGFYDGEQVFYAYRVLLAATLGVTDLSAEVQGRLQRKDGDWWLRGHRLELATTTAFENGAAADLDAGHRVRVSGVLRTDNVLVAQRLTLDTDEYFRLDGVVEQISADGRVIQIEGVDVQIEDDVSMRDDRDVYRWFAPGDLATLDTVNLIVTSQNDQLRAKRVVRKRAVRRLLRSRLQSASWFEARSMNRELDDIYDAAEISYNGQAVSGWTLRWLMKAGDDIEVEWDEDGRPVRVRAEGD